MVALHMFKAYFSKFFRKKSISSGDLPTDNFVLGAAADAWHVQLLQQQKSTNGFCKLHTSTYDNLKLITTTVSANTYYNPLQLPCANQLSCCNLRCGRSIDKSLRLHWFETQAGIMSTFRNCSACVCISSHWTRVAESSWDVDRAVRACIETTRSIALVGNSSVACREAAHQLKLGQYLVTTIVQLACHEVAGTLNKHNVQTCRWHHH